MHFRVLYIKEPIVIKDLAEKLGLRPPAIMKDLMDQGIFANINSTIDRDAAGAILKKYGMPCEFIE